MALQRRLPSETRRIVATVERTISELGTASPERGEAKIDQLIDGRLWFLDAVDHEPRIIKLNASGPHENRLTFAIFDVKLSTAIALGYDFGSRVDCQRRRSDAVSRSKLGRGGRAPNRATAEGLMKLALRTPLEPQQPSLSLP